MQNRGFDAAVYRLANLVPPGKVSSYGQLALLAGKPNWARRAGLALSRAPAHMPCHRIVNSTGRPVPGWAQQRVLLEKEGVVFKPNGCVDMRKHRMTPADWLALLNLLE